MMKMIFKLNEEKIKADGKTVEEIVAMIDAAFNGKEHSYEKSDDDRIVFSAPESDDEFNVFGAVLVYFGISHIEILPYFSEWAWNDYDEDGTLIEEEDVYEQVKDGKYCR